MYRPDPVPESNPAIEVDLRIAGMLTGKTTKTMQRWCIEGLLPSRVVDQRGKRHVLLDALLPHTELKAEDSHLVKQAAAGDAEAHNEIGMIYLLANKPELAYEWINLAGKAGHADAMHWLAKYFIYGTMGKEKNETLGLSWLAAAAAKGHVIARAQWAQFGIGNGCPAGEAGQENLTSIQEGKS